MASEHRVVRAFVCSTFRDMHAERDHLVTVVFPELRERLGEIGLEFFDVDLRWGVPAHGIDGELVNSWAYCKKWIDRVDPFFVCILGQRYGSIPPADRTMPRGKRERSITEMEIRHAVLDRKRWRHRSFFYLRDREVPEPPLTPDHVYGEFVERQHRDRLASLVGEIGESGRPVRRYPCEWLGDRFGGLEAFGTMVLEDLWSGVLRDPRYISRRIWRRVLDSAPDRAPVYRDESAPIPEELSRRLVHAARPTAREPLDIELQEMASFAAERSRGLFGRDMELSALEQFVLADSNEEAARVCALVARPGMGKSALLAALSRRLKPADCKCIAHFVGASPGSNGLRSLLARLHGELDRAGLPRSPGQQAVEAEIVGVALARRLARYAGPERIVILLDGVDQLTSGHDLRWLPRQPGPSVRIVISSVDNPGAARHSPAATIATALELMRPEPARQRLDSLDGTAVHQIVSSYLLEYCKELEAETIQALCAPTQSHEPLYLLALLSEIRTVGGTEMNRRIRALIEEILLRRPTTIDLFDWVLERLEVFGRSAVAAWCTYLDLGRQGMSSRELHDLLIRKLGHDAGAASLRIERGLRRYLQHRGTQLDFFHSALRAAARRRYAAVDRGAAHAEIAEYFTELWSDGDAHSLGELPHHWLETGRWHELAAVLSDVAFLTQKCEVVGIDAILIDLIDALDAIPADAPERAVLIQVYTTLDGQAHVLRKEPRLLPQVLHNELAWAHDREPYLWTSVHAATLAPKSTLLLDARIPVGGGDSKPLRTIAAPSRGLARIAISPDGRWIAGAGAELGTCVWEAKTGILRRILATEHSHDLCVAFNSDGSHLATGGWWSQLRIWDTESGSLARDASLPTFVEDLAYAPLWQSFVVATDHGGVLRLRDDDCSEFEQLYEDRPEAMPPDLPDFLRASAVAQRTSQRVLRVAIAPDGRSIAAGSASGVVGLADMSGAGNGWVFQPQPVAADGEDMPPQVRLVWERVSALAFSPDGRWLASAHRSWRWRLWDVRSSTPLHERRGHRAAVVSLAFHPSGERLATGGEDGEINLWNVSSGQREGTIVGHFGFLISLAFSPDGSRLYSACDDGTIKVWDVASAPVASRPRGHRRIIYGARFSPNARFLASWDEDFSLRTWRVESMSLEKSLEFDAYVLDVAFSLDETLCAVATKSGRVSIYETATWQEQAVLGENTSGARCVEFSPDGALLAIGHDSGQVCLWNVLTRVCATTLKPLANTSMDFLGIDSLSFSQDGSRLFIGADIPDLFVCTLADRKLRRLKPRSRVGARQRVRAMSASERLIACNVSQSAEIIDTTTGAIVRTLAGPIDDVRSKAIAISRDDRYIVTAGDSERVDLWSSDTGERVGVYHCPHRVVTAHFSRDGDRLFAADLGGSMHIPNVCEIRVVEPAGKADGHRRGLR